MKGLGVEALGRLIREVIGVGMKRRKKIIRKICSLGANTSLGVEKKKTQQ